MALTRSIEDSDKHMRNAAIERLRSEHGIKLTKHNRCATRIADAIRVAEPDLNAKDAMALIRIWLGLKPSDAVPSRLAFATGRPYVFDERMRMAAARVRGLPRLISMSSNVLYKPDAA